MLRSVVCGGGTNSVRVFFCINTWHNARNACCRAAQKSNISAVWGNFFEFSQRSSSTAADISRALPTVSSFSSTGALLDHVSNNVQVFEQQPALLAKALGHLVQLHYDNLGFPWLQPVLTVARLQLSLLNKTDEVMSPLWRLGTYQSLVEMIGKHHQKMDNLSLVRSLEYLLLLFEDNTGPLLHQVLSECLQRQVTFDMMCLGEFGACVRQLPKGVFLQTLRPSIVRFLELVPSVRRTVTPEGLSMFADTLRNLHLYMSHDRLLECSETLLSLTHECLDDLTEPSIVNSVSYTARRLYGTDNFREEPWEVGKIAMNVMKCAKMAASRIADKYSARQIAEICSSLKLTRLYTPDISEVMVARSLQLLQQDVTLADTINLFYALNNSTSPEIKRKFESVLYPKMTDVDSLSLSNLAEAFQKVNLDNRDLILRFQQLVIMNFSTLCQATSRLYYVLKFLHQIPKLEDNTERYLVKTLQQYIKQNQSIVSFHTPTIANFCLRCISGRVPDFLFQEILKSVPRWRIASLKKILIDLTANRKIYTPQLHMLITEIQHQIYKQVVEKPDVIQNVRQLTSFVHLMALHAYYRDQALTDKLMSLYLNFTHELDHTNMGQVAKIFTILKYYLPEVLEELTQIIVGCSEAYPLDIWVQVLGTCSVVGYCPNNIDKYAQALFRKLNQSGDSDDVTAPPGGRSALLQELRVMRWLTLLQYYPEDRLSQIFSMDFIEKVDDFLGVHPECQREVEEVMMILNRNVVLDCPQLDVPWFHEAYCQQHVSTDECTGNYKQEMLREHVHECLQDAVGGPQYINTCTFSPYYYLIDFECILDKDNRAVDYSSVEDIQDPDLQKVAIIPLSEGDFCYNTQRLANTQSNKLRHLQILGYKVIQIPFFTWYSMGLAEHESKVDLLKEQIFFNKSGQLSN